MKHDFPYLRDTAFLKEFDKIKLKQQFVKLIILTFDQKPIQQIQGKAKNRRKTLHLRRRMYRYSNGQISLSDFKQPVGMNLKESNRWVKKAQTIPWMEIEKRYAIAARLYAANSITTDISWRQSSIDAPVSQESSYGASALLS